MQGAPTQYRGHPMARKSLVFRRTRRFEFGAWTDHQCVRKIQAGTGGIFGVVCKERYFVSCGADKSIRLFNPINGRCESVLAGENRNSLGILDMALSKDGSTQFRVAVNVWYKSGTPKVAFARKLVLGTPTGCTQSFLTNVASEC
jgi:hypothetical protein